MTTPDKHFIFGPNNAIIRKKLCNEIKRDAKKTWNCLLQQSLKIIKIKYNAVLWTISLFIGISALFSTYIWNKSLEKPGVLSSVLHGSTHRWLWTLLLAWITLYCQFINKKGLLSRFLGSETFVPFSRITFMVYLIHMTVMQFYYGTARKTTTYGFQNLMFLFWGFVAISYLMAIILTLIFESPFLSLQRDLMKLTDKKRREKN